LEFETKINPVPVKERQEQTAESGELQEGDYLESGSKWVHGCISVLAIRSGVSSSSPWDGDTGDISSILVRS
jgi:hypothetical protein